MKIRSVSHNNRKKAFEVKTASKTLSFPFAKLLASCDAGVRRLLSALLGIGWRSKKQFSKGP